MRQWLAICSVLPLAVATAARGQTKELVPEQPAPARTANFSLSDQSWTNEPAPLAGGMITTEGSTPNSLLGFGLVRMHGRKRNGSDMRPGAAVDVETRNPAVTFVLKF